MTMPARRARRWVNAAILPEVRDAIFFFSFLRRQADKKEFVSFVYFPTYDAYQYPKPLFSLLSSYIIPTHSYCLFHAMPGLNSMA
jgi:hypothetical protein